MTGLRVLVTGGRDYRDRGRVFMALDQVNRQRRIRMIISGGAPGADKLAWEWGWAAGPIRNQRMIDEGKPDLVVAFPGGRGTADMVRRAKAAGIEVIEVTGGEGR